MILIIGGAYQGKRAFAQELMEENQVPAAGGAVLDGADLESGRIGGAGLICGLHLWIRRMLEQGKNPQELVLRLLEEAPQLLITLDELGCGVVPMEVCDRRWRETTGRIGCLLAERAERVYRVTCGIGVRIK